VLVSPPPASPAAPPPGVTPPSYAAPAPPPFGPPAPGMCFYGSYWGPCPPSYYGLSEVYFEANRQGNQYTVTMAGKQCETPCKLWLPRGPGKLVVSGDGNYQLDLDILPRPGNIRLQHPWNRLLIAGVTMMALGSVMMLSNLGLPSVFNSDDGGGAGFGAIVAFGWVLGPITHLIGIGLMAGGLAQISGSNRVVFFGGEARNSTETPALQLVGLGLVPVNGGATGGVRFAF
jgi:hypothetical protein